MNRKELENMTISKLEDNDGSHASKLSGILCDLKYELDSKITVAELLRLAKSLKCESVAKAEGAIAEWLDDEFELSQLTASDVAADWFIGA